MTDKCIIKWFNGNSWKILETGYGLDWAENSALFFSVKYPECEVFRVDPDGHEIMVI